MVARKSIYSELTRKEVAEAAEVAPTLVTHYFGDVENLRREIMSAAISENDEIIVAQGLARGDKQARKAPEALKNKAAKKLATR
jgi:AcrR family transcriptional regulator